MLRNVNDLYGFSVAASDGPIGEVRDCYFDDQSWTIRFFVVETGPWLGGRKVLISPLGVHSLHWADKALSASVTKTQVKVSRQHEAEQFGYYGYPYYWGEGNLWGGGPRPGTSLAGYGVVELPTCHDEPRRPRSP